MSSDIMIEIDSINKRINAMSEDLMMSEILLLVLVTFLIGALFYVLLNAL